MTTYVDAVIVEQVITRMEEAIARMIVNLDATIDRAFKSVLADFKTTEPKLKSSEELQDPKIEEIEAEIEDVEFEEAQAETEIKVGVQAIVGTDQVQLNELTKSEEDGKLLVKMSNDNSDLAEQQLMVDQVPRHKVISKTSHIIDVREKFDAIYSMNFVDEIFVVNDPYGFRLLVMGKRNHFILEQVLVGKKYMDLVDLASPFLSNIIKQRAEDAAIHYETVDVVGNLVHSSLNIKKVLDAGALQPVISLLTSCYSDSQRETAYLLGQFATTDSDCKIHILQKSAVRPLIEMLHPTNVQIKEMVAFALWRLTQDTHKQVDIAHHSGVQRLQDREFIIQTTKDQCSKFLQLGVGFDDDYVQVLPSIVSWTVMIEGFTWHSSYKENPLFLLEVNGEKFLVTYSSHEPSNPCDANRVVINIFYVRIRKVIRDFKGTADEFAIGGVGGVAGVSWPVFRWGGGKEDKYFAKFGKNMISVYKTETFSLVDKKSLKVENVVDFSWSPTDSILALFVLQLVGENQPARVSLVQIPSKKENKEAKNFAVAIVSKANAGLQLLKQRKILHGFLWKNRKMGLDMFMGSTLIEFYSKGGKMGDAFRVFKEFEKPNVVFWISMMSGYEQNGCFEKVVLLLSRMVVEDGVHLDSVTIISLVHVYATLMNLELVRGIYGIVFYFLGSTKELDKAMDLTKRILILAKPHVWGALLVVCRIYHHVEMGELAAKNLLFLDPNHAGVGVAGLVLTVSEEKVIAIKMGDIVAPVFGVCTWWYTELMVIFMSDTSQGHKAGKFTGFFLIGSSDIFTGFTTEFVKIAWDVDDDTIKVLVGKQTGKGIVKLESNVKNADKVVVLDCKNLPLGGEVGLDADIVRMEGNLVCSLGFSCDSSLQVTYTVKTQMSCFSSLLPSFFSQVGERIHTEATAVSKLAGMTSDLIGSYTESSYATLIVASISHFGIDPCLITTLIAIDFFEIKTVKKIELLVKRQLAAMYGIAVAILDIVSP